MMPSRSLLIIASSEDSTIEHELLRTLFGGAPRLFRPQSRDAEAELPRKRQRDVDLRFGEAMRLFVIGHEFSGEPAADHDRNESNRGDAVLAQPFP